MPLNFVFVVFNTEVIFFFFSSNYVFEKSVPFDNRTLSEMTISLAEVLSDSCFIITCSGKIAQIYICIYIYIYIYILSGISLSEEVKEQFE